MLDLSETRAYRVEPGLGKVLAGFTSLTHLNLDNFSQQILKAPTKVFLEAAQYLTKLRVLRLGRFKNVATVQEEIDLSTLKSLCLLEDLVLPNCKASMADLKLFPNLRRLAISNAPSLLPPLISNSETAFIQVGELVDRIGKLPVIFAIVGASFRSILSAVVCRAAQADLRAAVRWVLEARDKNPTFHPNTQYDAFSPPALAYARTPSLVELLLDNGADVNQSTLVFDAAEQRYVAETALSFASRDYSMDGGVVAVLLSRGAIPSPSSLRRIGRFDVSEPQLASLGDKFLSLFDAVEDFSRYLFDILTEVHQQNSPRVLGILRRILEMVPIASRPKALQAYVHPSSGRMPLHLITCVINVKFFYDYVADLDGLEMNRLDSIGQTPLMRCIAANVYGNQGILQKYPLTMANNFVDPFSQMSILRQLVATNFLCDPIHVVMRGFPSAVLAIDTEILCLYAEDAPVERLRELLEYRLDDCDAGFDLSAATGPNPVPRFRRACRMRGTADSVVLEILKLFESKGACNNATWRIWDGSGEHNLLSIAQPETQSFLGRVS